MFAILLQNLVDTERFCQMSSEILGVRWSLPKTAVHVLNAAPATLCPPLPSSARRTILYDQLLSSRRLCASRLSCKDPHFTSNTPPPRVPSASQRWVQQTSCFVILRALSNLGSGRRCKNYSMDISSFCQLLPSVDPYLDDSASVNGILF